jgi:predicted transcriptional regulator
MADASFEPTDVTEAELAVLEVLWAEGSAPIRRIADLLYPAGGAAQYATVQKLLERLEGKHCVARDRSGFAHQFTAAIGRDDLIGRRLQDVAEKLCEGSLTPLLLHLVQGVRLSSAERDALQKLIDDSQDSTK